MRYLPLIIGAAFAAPTSLVSHAADLEFNGFLSATGGIALKQFENNRGEEEDVLDYTDDLSFNNDSLFGLQAQARLSDKTSVTGQIISRGEDDYATELAWGYVSYAATNNLTLRMGRFRTPYYTYSAFIDVGYAYPWITPSDSFYSIQFNNIDGVDLVYNTPLTENTELELQVYTGSVNDEFQLADIDRQLVSKVRNQIGLASTISYGDFSFRASIHTGDFTAENFTSIVLEDRLEGGSTIQDLKNNLSALAPALGIESIVNDINADLEIDELETRFTQAGIKYDGERFFFVSEINRVDFDGGPAADQKRFHSTFGVNFGNTTVFVGYAESDDEPADLLKGLAGQNIDQQIFEKAGIADTNFESALNAVSITLSQISETVTAGIRYDFDAGAALKIQYDAITRPKDTISSQIISPAPGGLDGDSSEGVLRFGVDLVF